MIKHQLVDITMLYPKLLPSNNHWEDIYKEHLKKLKSQRHAIGNNTLEGAAKEMAELPRSPAANGAQENEASKEQAPAILENQRLGLLNALLSIGALQSSEWILLRCPNFLGYDTSCAQLLCRLVNLMLDKLGDHHSKSFAPSSLSGLDAPSSSAYKPKKIYLTLAPLNLQPDQVFYYPDWTEEVDSQPTDRVFFWIKLLGPNLRDNILFSKLTSMAKEPLRLAPDSPLRIQWTNIIRFNLLPSLLVCGGNEGNHNNIWDTLSVLPSQERFGFYNDWVYGTHNQSLEAKALLFSAKIKVNQLTSRITSENAREFGRHFKTEIHNSPGVVFSAVLKAIMRYDQNSQFVEVFRFLSKLASDVFHFLLLDLLADPEARGVMQPSRLKDDCINTESWLKHLAQFVCSLCRKYSFISISLLLNYITNQLHDGNHFDLVVLSEFLTKLGGIETHDSLNDIYAMSGGKALKSEAYPQSTMNNATSSSAGRLADALVISKILPILVVLISRIQQNVIFDSKVSPYLSDEDILQANLVPGLTPGFIRANKQGLFLPKVLSSHFDSIQDILLRLTELITNHCDPEKLSSILPPLDKLCLEYGLSPVLAFNFLRPSLSYRVHCELSADISESVSELQSDVEQGELVELTDPSVANGKSSDTLLNIWPNCLKEITQQYQLVIKPMVGINTEFFITFWQLQLSDIHVPRDLYETHLVKLNQLMPSERHSSLDEDRNRLKKRSDALSQERDVQLKKHAKLLQRLQKEMSHWFADSTDPISIADRFLEECVFPRSVFSGPDALYCATYIRLLHDIGTPRFFMPHIVDRILAYLKRSPFLFTGTEARHFGLFLNELFTTFSKWHANATAFDEAVIQKNPQGFQVETTRARSAIKGHSSLTGHSLTDHDYFQFQLLDWHKRIYNVACFFLDSGEYMQTHNAFVILAQLEGTFPHSSEHCSGLLQRIESTIQNDTNKEFSSLALAYKAKLLKLQPQCVAMTSYSKIYGFVRVQQKASQTNGNEPSDKSSTARPSNSQANGSRQNGRGARGDFSRPGPGDETDRNHTSGSHRQSRSPLKRTRPADFNSDFRPDSRVRVANSFRDPPPSDRIPERVTERTNPPNLADNRFPAGRDRSRYDSREPIKEIIRENRDRRVTPREIMRSDRHDGTRHDGLVDGRSVSRNDRNDLNMDSRSRADINQDGRPPANRIDFRNNVGNRDRRNDYDNPLPALPPRGNSPVESRNNRQRLDPGEADGFGNSRNIRRSVAFGIHPSGRRLPSNNAANAHLQDGHNRRHDNSSHGYNRQGY